MPASSTIYGLRGIWSENDASQISVHPRVGEVSGTQSGVYPRRRIDGMSVEAAILMWLAAGAGIAAGVFVVARSAIQIGSVACRVMEKQLTGDAADDPAQRRDGRWDLRHRAHRGIRDLRDLRSAAGHEGIAQHAEQRVVTFYLSSRRFSR